MQAPSSKLTIYTKLCFTPEFQLKGTIVENKICLLLRTGGKPYSGEASAMEGKLNQLFENNANLLEYLQEKENVSVDADTGRLTLMGKHPVKKAERVELYSIQLHPAHEEEENPMDIMIEACGQQQPLSNQQMKKIIHQLAIKVRELQAKTNGQEQMQRFSHKIQYLGNELENLKMKTADLFDVTDRLTQKSRKEIEIYKMQLAEVKEKNIVFQDHFNQEIANSDGKIKKLYEKLLEQEQLIKELLGKPKVEYARQAARPQRKGSFEAAEVMVKREPSEVQTLQYLDKTAKYLRHFVVIGNNITKQDDFIFPTILIGSKSMRARPEYTVRIKQMGILQQIYPGVCVGIVDSKNKHKQSCGNGDNVIELGCGGKLFESNKYIRTEEQGFLTGEVITVKVNFQARTIEWIVNHKVRCSLKTDLLGKADIDWRPYVFMRDKGDSIDWISQQ